jgi:hypothetical protein
MLTPQQYSTLTVEGQRAFINSLSPARLQHFCIMLNTWMARTAKDADMLALFGSSNTTDNIRYNAQMLKRSKDDTLVDVIARYPQLKLCPAVMELVREDFNKVLRPSRHR